MIDLINIVELISRLSRFTDTPLTEAQRKQFQSELICTIGFAGLKPIRRWFV